MTTIAADSDRAIGLGDRIGTITQVKGAIARLRRAGLAALWLWLGGGVAMLAANFLGGRLAGDLLTVALSPRYVAYLVASTLAASVIGALALRLMISGPTAWLRLDRALAEGGALFFASTLSLTLYGVLFSEVSTAAAGAVEAETSGTALFATVGLLAGYVGLMFAWMRLQLWPAARLMGRSDIGPVRSWRLMKKATRGLVLGYVLFAIPLVGIFALFMQGYIAAGAAAFAPAMIVVQFGSIAFTIAAYGLVATIYTLRVERPATVADVFA